MEIVKDIADEFEESPNGVRMILTKAGVYVKKAPASGGSKTTASGGSGGSVYQKLPLKKPLLQLSAMLVKKLMRKSSAS